MWSTIIAAIVTVVKACLEVTEQAIAIGNAHLTERRRYIAQNISDLIKMPTYNYAGTIYALITITVIFGVLYLKTHKKL